MKVSRWGNSLAVRLPADQVAAWGIKEGDEIELTFRRENSAEVLTRFGREQAIDRMMNTKWPLLPPGYKFDRDEANER